MVLKSLSYLTAFFDNMFVPCMALCTYPNLSALIKLPFSLSIMRPLITYNKRQSILGLALQKNFREDTTMWNPSTITRINILPVLDQKKVHQQGNPCSLDFPCNSHKPFLPKPEQGNKFASLLYLLYTSFLLKYGKRRTHHDIVMHQSVIHIISDYTNRP